jgi:hypothetical protein
MPVLGASPQTRLGLMASGAGFASSKGGGRGRVGTKSFRDGKSGEKH